jgi:tetratricopeptide (TPR) repeat protein
MALPEFPFLRAVCDPGADLPAGAYVVGAMMTPDFTRCGERLAASCRAHSLPLALFEVPTVHRSISVKGSGDPRYTKANFVSFLLERYGRPVLYLDVDCVIAQRPERIERLMADRVDFAIFNWLAEEHTEAYVPANLEPRGRFYRFSHSIDHRSDTQLLCSGAVQWYHRTPAARALLDAWQAVIERAPGAADDKCLDLAFNNFPQRSPRLNWAWLEKPYARIAWWIYVPPVIDHPEIPHLNDGFVGLDELDGRPRIHYGHVQPQAVSYIFPKELLIDTETRTLLRLEAGNWRPQRVFSTELWLPQRNEPGGDPEDPSLEEQFRKALALHQQARLDDAERAYREVLERQPRHVHALNFLGVIALHAGRAEEALDLVARALEIDPQHVGALFVQGQLLMRMERWEAALASLEQATAVKPDFVGALLHCADVLGRLGRYAEAVRRYDRIIELDANIAEAHNNRGNALRQLQRHDAAIVSYDRAISLSPQTPEPYFNRGLALHSLKHHDAALASFDQALQVNPHYAQAYFARGNVLKDVRQLGAALASYDRAIAARGDYAEAFANRGNVLAELDRSDAALASYERAIAFDPRHIDAYCNRGNLLSDLGRLDEAITCLDDALAIDPDHAQAHFTRAFVCLLRGDFPQGWREFEWRWKSEHCVTSREKRYFPQPQWRGNASLEGKTLFVHCEQGLGDTIQFCRYLKLAAARGARVIFEVPPALRRLLAGLEGVAQPVLRGETLPAFDYYCPLLSLPMAFNTTLDTVPVEIPYLRVNPERALYWREKLGVRTRPRVGLVWSGGFRPDQPELWNVNRRRNIPLSKLAALRHPEVEFYSLQKGQPAEGELGALIAEGWEGPAIADLTGELDDFEETAALIQQLDLVISVDTSTAHLAGALGKPVWLLNRFDTCWRWMWERSDSPWYPTLRLYRQTHRGDWDGVVSRVRIDLDKWARSR